MRTILAVLLLTVTLAAPAFAVPYSYEFTSGGLTGTWTTEPPNGIQWSALSWHIVTPDGMVWDSANPLLTVNEDRNFGDGLILQPMFSGSADANGNNILMETDGPTNQNPTMSTGAYTWSRFSNGVFNTGVGDWRLVTPSIQSVPEPPTLWPFAIGLAGVAWLAVWRRKHAV
jgi:hypothetical protein